MHRASIVAALMLIATSANAQIPRTRSPNGAPPPSTEGAIPRDARFPYAGLWMGHRTMPLGGDDITFQFSVADEKYSGAMLFPNGGRAPHVNLKSTAAGLTWESPNSGGGTWVYAVRLAGPDSMVGTLVLRDPPPNLTPAPTGTLVLKRQAAK